MDLATLPCEVAVDIAYATDAAAVEYRDAYCSDITGSGCREPICGTSLYVGSAGGGWKILTWGEVTSFGEKS